MNLPPPRPVNPRRLHRLVMLVGLVGLLLLSACTLEDVPDDVLPSPTAEPEETPTPDADDELTAQCTNPDGFTVSYPEGWSTNETTEDALPPCSLFDPQTVDTGDALEVPADIALFLRIEAVAFDATEDDVTVDVVDRSELTVNGHTAVREETEATGDGMFPEGTRSTMYRVDLGEQTFIAVTRDEGDPAYEVKQQVLDAMIDTLTFAEQAA
jgi:hypothetical protein